MATKLPSMALRRVHLPKQTTCTQQVRHASLIKRPHRPYTFTQLVTLSDGSTYTQRTTSPAPIFRSTKDTRNHALWQPSMDSLRNVEQDEAGRLKAFRRKFGRGWDAESVAEDSEEGGRGQAEDDSLMDLISGGATVKESRAKRQSAGDVVDMITVKKDGLLVKVPAKEKKPKSKTLGWGG
ncbi:50S ribosomal protein [Diplocarpon rosae]|nr:50S ribosomal protein [Diplocarpon rosae]